MARGFEDSAVATSQREWNYIVANTGVAQRIYESSDGEEAGSRMSERTSDCVRGGKIKGTGKEWNPRETRQRREIERHERVSE